MEEKQRVYIKGSVERGNEVIKLLEDLGGCNFYNCKGGAEKNIYYINPLGYINCVMECQYSEWLLVKEFYKEITLPKWKPKYEEQFFFICPTGIIGMNKWYGTNINESYYEFENCFKTKEEAEVMAEKIKKLLNTEP